MSGGRFQHMDSSLKSEIFGWTDKPINVFEDREISELIWDVLDLIHEYDWYASSDTTEEHYFAAKAEFKNKWLKGDKKTRDARMKRIIDEVITEAREDLYKTFGVGEEQK